MAYHVRHSISYTCRMRRQLLSVIIMLMLTACGAPSAESPDAITTWRTTVEHYVRQLSPTIDEMRANVPRYYQDEGTRQRVDDALTAVQDIHDQLVQLHPTIWSADRACDRPRCDERLCRGDGGVPYCPCHEQCPQ